MNTTDAMRKIAELDLEQIKVKLMHAESGEGWSLAHANAIEVEYRRFLRMMHMYPEENFAPLFDVDIFWHYHILDTRKYAADCQQAFGYFVHHYPYVGLGEDDAADHQALGARMHALYRSTFGEDCLSGEHASAASADKPSATAASAWCSIASVQATTAWCSMSANEPVKTAWCSLDASQPRKTAWCSLSVKDAVRSTQGAPTAWCSVTAASAASASTAWCSLKRSKPAQTAGTAWCSVSAASPKTAWCSRIPTEPAHGAQTAWCSRVDIKPALSAQTAWCSLRAISAKTAWCSASAGAAANTAWCSAAVAAAVRPSTLASPTERAGAKSAVLALAA